MLHCQHVLNSLHSEHKKYSAFCELLWMVPGLEDHLMNSSEEEVIHISNLICRLEHPTLLVLTILSGSKGC